MKTLIFILTGVSFLSLGLWIGYVISPQIQNLYLQSEIFELKANYDGLNRTYHELLTNDSLITDIMDLSIMTMTSGSMYPTINVSDRMIVQGTIGIEDVYTNPQDGDIIVFYKPVNSDEIIVSRAIERMNTTFPTRCSPYTLQGSGPKLRSAWVIK